MKKPQNDPDWNIFWIFFWGGQTKQKNKLNNSRKSKETYK